VELILIDPDRTTSDIALAREAVAAIRAGEIGAAFQPVVDAQTPGRVLFREALVRLHRPSGEVVPAGRFMPTLTRLGMAAEADAAMLNIVMDALAADETLRISVNLSAQSFSRPRWRERFLERVMTDEHLAERLIVEMSEDVATCDLSSVLDLLALLRAAGVTLALDDFGAGRTSVSHLRDARFDMVKIDGGFIQGIDRSEDNQVLVSALVSIAHSFDMMVVAEYVETAREARTLRKLGVEAFQGFLFGGPTLVWSDGRRVAPARA
jgi:EAL domain-containing protein (putative c-di-GMP-specific phosphodiesterase class I)